MRQGLLGTISGEADMHLWTCELVVWYSPVSVEYHTTDNGGLARGWSRKMASPGIPVPWGEGDRYSTKLLGMTPG